MSSYTITLNKPAESDYPLFASWWNDHRVADGVRKTLEQHPLEENEALFRQWAGNDSADGFGYAIYNNDGLCVGFISAWGLACGDERDAQLALIVGPYYQGHGYGSQALHIALHELAEKLHANTITVHIAAHNLRARHMFAERGFKEIDRLHHAIERDGKPFDIIVMRAAAQEAVRSTWQDNPYDDTVELIPRRNIFRVE